MDNIENKPCEIFISYRRSSGWELARYIYQELSSNGYEVFFDLEKLFKGKFDTKIRSKLLECKVFLPILTRDTLKRINDEGDWVAREINLAIKHKKIIIPITTKGFYVPKKLSKNIKWLLSDKCKKIEIDVNDLENSIRKLCAELIKHFETSSTKTDEFVHKNRYTAEWVKRQNNIIKKTTDYSTYIEHNAHFINEAIKNKQLLINRDAQTINNFIAKQNFKKLSIIEIGARNGLLISKLHDILSKQIEKYVGIEPVGDNYKLLEHITKRLNPAFEAHQLFPDEKNFATDLQKTVKGKFNVAILYHTLYQYKDPERIIAAVKSVLDDNGIIILADIDDSFNIAYPDKYSVIKQYKEIKNSTTAVGNIYTGRELCTYLNRADFKDVELKILVANDYLSFPDEFFLLGIRNSDLSGYTRNRFKFADEVSVIINYLKKNNSGPLNDAKIKWLEKYTDAIIEQMFASNCLHTITTFFVCGKK